MNVFPASICDKEARLAVDNDEDGNTHNFELLGQFLYAWIFKWQAQPWHVSVVLSELVFCFVHGYE